MTPVLRFETAWWLHLQGSKLPQRIRKWSDALVTCPSHSHDEIITIFTRYSTASFACPFFILTANRTLISRVIWRWLLSISIDSYRLTSFTMDYCRIISIEYCQLQWIIASIECYRFLSITVDYYLLSTRVWLIQLQQGYGIHGEYLLINKYYAKFKKRFKPLGLKSSLFQLRYKHVSIRIHVSYYDWGFKITKYWGE